MDRDNYDLKTVEGMSSKPFYLKSPKANKRVIVVIGIMLILLGLVNPFLLITLPFYAYFAVKHFKQIKSKENILLSRAIYFYEKGMFQECSDELSELIDIDSENIKARIILALITYERGEYDKVIEMLNNIPNKILDADLDLQLRLAESYVNLGRKEEAVSLYNKLLKIYPRSSYLKEKISSLEVKEAL